MRAALVLALIGTLCAYTGVRLMCTSDDGWGMFGEACAYLGAVLLFIAALGAASS